ncbi:MAG: tetratricopeptide repeat protein, partial [Myxococcales bacterium]|nr:tetratricopeptide repeat protein [Myxococcales bacterium]
MKLLDNPYTIGRPIVDPAGFVGREELLEAVRAALLVDGHKGVGIRGGRRMGRSSILHQLRARMAAVPELRPVYVDLRSRLRAPIEVMVPHLAQAVARGLHIGAPRLLGPADIAFREAWLPEKIDALDGAKLVLLLDSFEGLVEPSRAAAAASFYRYIGGLLGRVQNLRVIASFGHQVTGVGSDVVAGFQVFDVPPLELEDVQALMLRSHKQGTLRWEPRAGMAVWALTRGHPELTQLLCSEVWEELNYYDPSSVPEVTVSEVHSAANKAVESAAPIVDRLWSSFEPASRVVLAALASQPSEEVSLGELWRALGESGVHELGPRIEAVPRELEARGVLERVAGDDGDRLRIRYPLLHKALARHRPLRRVQAELDRVEPEADAYYRDALDLTKDPERRGSDAIVARLRSALELNPNHAKAMALLADILLKDGEEDEAVRLLERLYEIQPDAA